MPFPGHKRRCAELGMALLSLCAPAQAALAQGDASVPFSAGLRTETRLVDFEPEGEVRCGDGVAHPTSPLDVTPTMTTAVVGMTPAGVGVTAPSAVADPSLYYAFDIDDRGRPRTLRRTSGSTQAPGGYAAYVDDGQVAPALAAWTFPAGAAHAGCAVQLRARRLTFAKAGRVRLMRAIALGAVQTPDKAWRDQALPGSDCYDGERLHGRVIHLAPVDEMHESPGRRSWSVVSFDVGADGHTRNVVVAASSGKAELDGAAMEAIRQSRYAPEPKKQCAVRFYTAPGKLEAPSPVDDPDPKGGPCPPDTKLTFTLPPRYPAPFRARAIEGYARLRFDVAPWGAVGAVKVLQSEPAEAFGAAASVALQSAHVGESESGTRGCVTTVRFKIDPSRPEGVDVNPRSDHAF